MSFAFYSSGERDYDENGELVYVLPSAWKDKDNSSIDENAISEPQKRNVARVVIPKELDEDYYISHRDNYNQGSRDWWDWERLRQYANATLEFFRISFREFVKVFNIDLSNQKVPAFLMKVGPYSLESCAEKMSQAEWALANQYTKNRRHFVTNKINRHKTIERLQKTAKLCWGYYYSCKGFFPVASAMKVGRMVNNLDELTDQQIVSLYGVCQKTKYHLLKLNKTVYSDGMAYYKDKNTRQGTTAIRSSGIYPNVKMMELFDLAMESFDLPKSDIFDNTLRDMQSISYNLASTDPLRNRELRFYDNYTTMRRLLWRVKCITNQCEEGYPPSLFPYDDAIGEVFPDEHRVDMYERAVVYMQSCARLAEDIYGYDDNTLKDVESLRDKFLTEVDRAERYYNRTHKIAEDNV